MNVRETTGKINPEHVLERVRQAFAEHDPQAWIDLYAEDAELQVVDCNTPPSSPRILRGKDEIASYWRDVVGRQMAHHGLQDEVVGEDRIACNLACEYPDGTKVLATMMFDLREGKIARQVDVVVWDE
jgi:SnoaL-like protein